MRNKIFTILGIMIVLVAVSTYILLDTSVKNNSEVMGVGILVVKDEIQEGVIIKDVEQAQNLFGVKKFARTDIIPNAIEVSPIKSNNENILDRVKGYFKPNEYELSKSDLARLVGKKVSVNLYRNQQVITDYFADDNVEITENERYYGIPTSYTDSVGAEVTKGDYVDVWISYDKKDSTKKPEKLIEALNVIKIKDEKNLEVTKDAKNLPAIAIFKLTEDQIALFSQKAKEGTLFLTKWGVTPEEFGVMTYSSGSNNSEVTETGVNEVDVEDIDEINEDDLEEDNLDREGRE